VVVAASKLATRAGHFLRDLAVRTRSHRNEIDRASTFTVALCGHVPSMIEANVSAIDWVVSPDAATRRSCRPAVVTHNVKQAVRSSIERAIG
jgi:hypothetical protein